MTAARTMPSARAASSMHSCSGRYEAETEERAFLREVVQGLVDLEAGCEMDLREVKQRLGLT